MRPLPAVLVVVMALCLPAATHAQPKAPEALLSAETLAYFRYDGYERHRQAYDKTALAKIMKDDLGEFMEYLLLELPFHIARNFGEEQRNEFRQVLESGKPLLPLLWKTGIAAGFELRERKGEAGDPEARLTLVFPDAGTSTAHGVFLAKLMGTFTKQKIRSREVRGRTVTEVVRDDNGAFDEHLSWWKEGPHFVVLFSSTDVLENALDVMDGKKPNLTTVAVQRQVQAFKSYETDMRGHVDLKRLVDLLRTADQGGFGFPEFTQALSVRLLTRLLGLTSLRELTFHYGFEGAAQRSTIAINVEEPARREGLLRLLTSPLTWDLKALPPLPPDVAWLSVHHADVDRIYQEVRGIVNLALVGMALERKQLPQHLWPENPKFGEVDLRKELFPALEPTFVAYNALSEGPILSGLVVALKVKDEAKVKRGMDALEKELRRLIRPDDNDNRVLFQKRGYRGADLFILESMRELPIPVTWTLHKGWLVLSPFPQAVKGYVLRCEGKHRVWQPADENKAVLAALPKHGAAQGKLAMVQVFDPRPSLEVGLALVPMLAQIANVRMQIFDVSRLPNAQAVNEHVFPEVTTLHDDGTALRLESTFALGSPYDLLASPLLLSIVESGRFLRGPLFRFGGMDGPREKPLPVPVEKK